MFTQRLYSVRYCTIQVSSLEHIHMASRGVAVQSRAIAQVEYFSIEDSSPLRMRKEHRGIRRGGGGCFGAFGGLRSVGGVRRRAGASALRVPTSELVPTLKSTLKKYVPGSPPPPVCAHSAKMDPAPPPGLFTLPPRCQQHGGETW